MTRPFGLPLAASIAGHCCLLAALILFIGKVPVLPLSAPPRRIEIMLAPPPAAPAQPPPIPPAPQPPPPPPPVVETAPPPPPPRPEPRRVVVRPPPRRPPPPRPEREVVPQPQYLPPPTRYVPYTPPQPAAPPQPAPAPPRPAAPLVSARYQAELNAWLAGHKEYPEGARERGEQGQVLLHFRVNRSGHVLSYSLGGSTGYPDLDAAVERMMRGAVLPPFPPDMAASGYPVSVTIRFGLR